MWCRSLDKFVYVAFTRKQDSPDPLAAPGSSDGHAYSRMSEARSSDHFIRLANPIAALQILNCLVHKYKLKTNFFGYTLGIRTGPRVDI
jgi:hypothetical protein